MPLLIRIDLVPGGALEQSREIARMIVTNDGTNTDAPAYGNYRLLVRYETAPERVVEQAGQARDVRRLDNPWHFLADVLELMDLD